MIAISKDLIAASSIPIILSTLIQGESYGYEIIKKIKEVTNERLLYSDGTLYPVLRKLEDKELIISEWRIADNDKRRRYYQITAKGLEYLKAERLSWQFMNELLNTLWTPLSLT
ncbi:transcriptional regulator, PadR family [Mucilaginibacter lappiensis]|uniref:DNA-binding PadR family transcriptional regulator n=1 Tax=Mucilaginibacter lappiensis TaxID=354630 RepID=A0ABR6PC72_9SPHI|nr:helix-turn-helix transcriptional regulator [Mucilaginibacter lappiensis]MBB6107347.1 DNA-binding PadR family transcriptional regulator [Mucilaginibacter lappiensis]SIQ11486.1 transcriptional regulator, PadR family [Mucilaginibacter lappiensis]